MHEKTLQNRSHSGRLRADAMTATAKAPAVLVVATAKREGVAFEEILKEILKSVAVFAIDMDARPRAS
jgi:hypothetical protein